MSAARIAIGLMSGTSLDGVDAAIVATDGASAVEPGPSIFLPYDRDSKIVIRRAIKAALEGRDCAADVGKAAGEVTLAHAAAVERLLAEAGLKPKDVGVVGFHGQTILHRPARGPDADGRSWQIGDGAALANMIGIDVVADFRSADIAAGGEGAPLAPIYHLARARALNESGPVAVLNIGGVANITHVAPDADELDIVAFDCGPGNGLIDEWMELKTGRPMDEDGAAARQGRVRADILRLMLDNAFIARRPPKSLDRYDFKLDQLLALSTVDGAATLTAFTAAAVRASLQFLPDAPARWIVCGGGRRNAAMMEALKKALAAPVSPAEDAGWNGDNLEAECFAYLAVRSLKKLPITFPKTTRAPRPLAGGVLHRHKT